MTWTYVPANLNTSAKDQVRLLVGDTLSTDPLITDEEINYLLTQDSNVYIAALYVCDAILTSLAKKIDLSTGPLSRSLSQKFDHYKTVRGMLEKKAQRKAVPIPQYFGNSQSEKIANFDPDRIGTAARIGGMDDPTFDPNLDRRYF